MRLYIRAQSTADATFTPLENKVSFENSAECAGKLLDSFSQNKYSLDSVSKT